MNKIEKIDQMRQRAVSWFETMEVPSLGEGVYTNSSHNKDLHCKDMLLPATYNATNCLTLLGQNNGITESKRHNIIAFFKSHLGEDGFYQMAGMRKEDVYYPTMEYDNFHITNYVLGALAGLGADDISDFSFLSAYNSISKLDRWLSRRDMTKPWTEGNYVVNLASFYIYAMENIDQKKYKKLIDRLFDWHQSMQDSQSGYWYDTKTGNLISAMAGASHNFHLYFYLNQVVPNYKKIIDHCLTILDGVTSACLDIDVVDVLVNMMHYGYRVDDIKSYLLAKLDVLLDYQNEDGGFSDVETGTRVFDGWEVYKEPQGISNCFATWFRCAAIGMISCALYPETRDQWFFRDTIGMGYFNKDYMKGVEIESAFPEKQIKPKRIWLKAYDQKAADKQSKIQGAQLSPQDLSRKVCDKFNEKDLSSFNKATAFSFCISNMDNICFTVLIENSEAQIIDSNSAKSDISITINDQNLLKIVEGKLMPVVAYATKKLNINGDMSLAVKLQNLF